MKKENNKENNKETMKALRNIDHAIIDVYLSDNYKIWIDVFSGEKYLIHDDIELIY